MRITLNDDDLRRCLEEIADEIKKSDKDACDYWGSGCKSIGGRYFGVASGLAKAKAIVLKYAKAEETPAK